MPERLANTGWTGPNGADASQSTGGTAGWGPLAAAAMLLAGLAALWIARRPRLSHLGRSVRGDHDA